jgi:hypothetical protein
MLGVMKPPKCKAMDYYAALLVQMGELEGAIEAAKQHVRHIPKQMSRELRTQRQRLDAARYLYWFTDIPAQDIAEGLLGMDLNGWHVDRFLERIGTMTIEVVCDRCHQPMECRSRSKMQDIMRDVRRGPRYAEGYRVLCVPCWDAVHRERIVS